jgi:hypothetical protein
MNRRLGRFRIIDIDANMREAKIVLARVVVVRAEMLYQDAAIEYTAISDDFDAVDDGAVVPEYLPLLQYDGMGGCKFKAWQRLT